MKKLLLGVILLCMSFTGNSQNNRMQLGPHDEFNNWLLYTKPNNKNNTEPNTEPKTGTFQLAPRKFYDGGLWSYDWNNSLLYHPNGKLQIGSEYGFRNSEGVIGLSQINQPKIKFFYTGNNTNSGDLQLAYGTAAGSAMEFGVNNSNTGFEKLMSLSKSGLKIYKYQGTSKLSVQTNQHNGMAILEIAGGTAYTTNNANFYSGWSIYHSYKDTNKDLYFRHGETGNPTFILKNEGSVGIGTTSTGKHKLAVDGSIGAREIKVESGEWSDFVFNKNYKLPTLIEVENYITKNNHLPEIPSEAEVKKNGINLGEMDAKLLQKIEELTLYLIEQNKRLDLQQLEIEELKHQLKK